MRIGILGGTFDPVHLGHLRSAEEICQELDLEKIYLIPSASPPHKTHETVTPFRDRLAMTGMAAAMSPCLETLDLEGKRPGHSYSIETLRDLHRTLGPHAEIFFVLGMDAFLEIKTWKEYQHLFDYAHFVVIGRPGFETVPLSKAVSDLRTAMDLTPTGPDVFAVPSGKTVRLIRTTLMDISSTRIRNLVGAHRSIRFLVPEKIGKYIAENRLYR